MAVRGSDEQRYKYMHGGRYGDRDLYLIREEKYGADQNYEERRYRPGFRPEDNYEQTNAVYGTRGYNTRETRDARNVPSQNYDRSPGFVQNRDSLTTYGNISSPVGGIRGIDYGHDLNNAPLTYRTSSKYSNDYDDDDDDRYTSGSKGRSYSPNVMRRSKTGRKKWTPLCDMGETDKYWVVRCEIPGVKKEKLTVQIEGKDLIIRGKRIKELWNVERLGSSSASTIGSTDSSGAVTTSSSSSTTVVKSNESGVISKDHKATETNAAGVTTGKASSEKMNPDGSVSSAKISWVDKERGGRGVFKRKIRLPARVEQSAVQALYKDGILEVLVRKPESVVKKRDHNRVAVN